MTLDLTLNEAEILWAEALKQSPSVTSNDCLETIVTFPPQMGHGYMRAIYLQPGLELHIFNGTFHNVMLHIPEKPHPGQFIVQLSGSVNNTGCPSLDAKWGCVSGSGIQRPWTSFWSESQHQMIISIEVQPNLLTQFFGTPMGNVPPELQLLMPERDQWQQMFSPQTTGAIRSMAQQILNCPYTGVSKRLYLQGKVFELMALQLNDIVDQDSVPRTTTLKPVTRDRIHQAAAILRSQLEHPPVQLELAKQVGLSDRTLRKGFQSVFGVTPFTYLTQQRMYKAEQLLREPDQTVADVSNMVGYANPAQFAAAFKRQFGISPSECLDGKKSVRNSVLG